MVRVWFFGRFLEIQSDGIFYFNGYYQTGINQVSRESWSAAGMKMRGATRSPVIFYSARYPTCTTTRQALKRETRFLLTGQGCRRPAEPAVSGRLGPGHLGAAWGTPGGAPHPARRSPPCPAGPRCPAGTGIAVGAAPEPAERPSWHSPEARRKWRNNRNFRYWISDGSVWGCEEWGLCSFRGFGCWDSRVGLGLQPPGSSIQTESEFQKILTLPPQKRSQLDSDLRKARRARLISAAKCVPGEDARLSGAACFPRLFTDRASSDSPVPRAS